MVHHFTHKQEGVEAYKKYQKENRNVKLEKGLAFPFMGDENYRGQHIGSSILEQAEKSAKERRCMNVFLDTFSFQAPEFYEKYGYKKVFTLK